MKDDNGIAYNIAMIQVEPKTDLKLTKTAHILPSKASYGVSINIWGETRAGLSMTLHQDLSKVITTNLTCGGNFGKEFLTPKQLEMNECILSTVATHVLVLKHQGPDSI